MDNEKFDLVSSFSSLSKEEARAIAENISTKKFKKKTILLREGEVSKNCYTVLKGCVREYYIVDGEEKTTAFFTEGQAVVAHTSYSKQEPSKHFLTCNEDCLLTISNAKKEKEMCLRFPKLEYIIKSEIEKNLGKIQEDFASFIISSPEQRYLNLLKNRPGLLNRIPQHQLASYIGIAPESLSRIRKRIASPSPHVT